MTKRVQWSLLLTALMLAVSVGFYALLYQVDNKYTAALPATAGRATVQADLDQVAFLVDGWEFYPGQLLTPEDIDTGDAEILYIGEIANFSPYLGSPYGVATYRIILENSGDAAMAALYLPELLCAGRIYVNGRLLGQQGSLTPYMPLVADRVYAFPMEAETEIIIQCANYSHYYSGMYYPPALGTSAAVAQMVAARLTVYGVLCFAALALALYHLVLWAVSRDRLIRWMGWLCLAFAVRVSYPFLRALGAPSVRLLYALEDLSGNLVLLCAMVLAGEITGLAVRWYYRRLAIPASVGLCAFTVVFPLLVLPAAPSFVDAYGSILFVWKLAVGLGLMLATCPGRDGHNLEQHLLCATSFYGLSLAATVILANRLEPIRGAWPEEYGGFVLVVGFAALMMRRWVLTAQENQRLSLKLREEVDRKTRSMERLLQERRELLESLIHDLKNPLAALRNYAALVRQGGVALDNETAAYLDALNERAETVGERLDLLHEFSRGERKAEGETPLCLNDFLQTFYETNRPDVELSGANFRLHLPRERLWVSGDPLRLQAALENLCYNAASFTPQDGRITLSLTRQDAMAAVAVADTGPGIAPSDLPHLFERGFTRRSDGSGQGLGLFLVRTIAIEHGGTVEVASQEKKGSTFTLLLPLAEP